MMTKPHRMAAFAGRPLVGFCLALGLAGPALAAGADAGDAPVAPPEGPAEVRMVGPKGQALLNRDADRDEIDLYCRNIADVAKDQRYAREAERLRDLEGRVDARISALEAKRADYQRWLKERRAFLDKASQIVVDIYSQMGAPEAAAQLAEIEADDAAAIIVKLKSRQASAVMAEMEPADAAGIAQLIVAKTAAGEADETVSAGGRSETAG